MQHPHHTHPLTELMPGTHLFRGDAADYLADQPAAVFDALITDPPYGLSAVDKSASALEAWAGGDVWFMPAGKGLVGCEWDAFVPPPGMWAEMARVLRPGAPAAVFSSPRTLDLMAHSLILAGFTLHGVAAVTNGQSMPKSVDIGTQFGKKGRVELAQRWSGFGSALKVAHDPVLILTAPGAPSAATAGRVGAVAGAGFRYVPKAPARERPEMTTETGARVAHPSVKALAAMEWLVSALTSVGYRVLDPFAGSGTTLQACARLGRRVVGVERDRDFADLIDVRLAADTEAVGVEDRWVA